MRDGWSLVVIGLAIAGMGRVTPGAEDPPAIKPFGAREKVREDALPGYVALSDGSVVPGRIYLTRDARLQIYDTKLERQREIPLTAVRRLDCAVEKEWLEKEWRFRENANDEKVYTGRAYPSRLYLHTITLKDGRKITGPISGIVYVDPYLGGKTQRFLLNKRQKGFIGTDLPSLVYLQTVELGEDALLEGQRRADQREQASASKGRKAPRP